MAMRLIIENLDGVTTMVPLDESTVTIGRTPDNTIQLSEQNVSRRHAEMVSGAEGWRIEDRSSYNGVMVNGTQIAETTTLREGDLIQIGDYHLVLTDSTDKETLDLQRPRRGATEDEPVLASSSTDLPQLSAGEIAALTGEPPAGDGAQRSRRVPWVAVGIAVACVAVMGVAALQLLGGGDKWTPSTGATAMPPAPTVVPPGPAAATPKVAQAAFPGGASPSTEPSPADGNEEFPLAELLPAGPSDGLPAGSAPDATPPVGDAAAGETSADMTAGERTEPAQTVPSRDGESPRSGAGSAKRGRRRGGPPRSRTPVQDAKVVLRRARSAASSDAPERAYTLARRSYDLDPTDDALFVMGKAACQLKRASRAKWALRKLDPRRQPQLLAACERFGVEL
ncbi:MAG: FHA domain-containing protein [Myxococcales bacterium FL481]|nr:MAG: FHA domain-containing protein [Myxococcales bacterium FL481]